MSGKKRKKSDKKIKRKPSLPEQPLSPEVWGWILLSSSAIMFLSSLNFAYARGTDHWLGAAGFTIGWAQAALFGISSYLFVFYIGWIGWRRLFNKSINQIEIKHLTIAIMILSAGMLLSVIESNIPQLAEQLGNTFYSELWKKKLHFHLGGAPIFYIYKDLPILNLERLLNAGGVFLLFSCTWIGSLLMLTKIPPSAFFQWFSKFRRQTLETPSDEIDPSRKVKLRIPSSHTPKPDITGDHEVLEIQPEKNLFDRPSLSKKTLKDALSGSQPFEGIKGKFRSLDQEQNIQIPPEPPKISKKEKAITEQRVYNGDFTSFKLPSTNLLTNPKKVDQSSLKNDLRKQAEVLEETLLSFGIEAKVGQINCGPTITSFEVHPAIGVKVQKVKALENDIALNMEAKSIRILAPIPGKAAIGIEVPNPKPQEVGFKDMLNAYQQGNKKFFIPVLLGKTVNGDCVMEDLTKMPHLIIAGATGSGKSVCINTIVMSILMTAKPDEIKLIMVDPKKVELTPYTRLPHMLAPVITEPAGACAAMKWLVKEMETRYELLKLAGFRNISSFNTREINKAFEASLDREIPEKLPYIVCIIDELADLMMVASNDMETSIARIAQMARAVGIHLILATQRPSREVITGLIKANFPARIAFKVSSRVNSQIILDEIGAEMLLGNGDMLFLPPGAHHLLRAQGAYIRDEDINGVVEAICSQAPPNYMIASFDEMDNLPDLNETTDDSSRDPLYDQAVEIVLSTGNASTTFLQRKLKLGYARAASIMDQLEKARVVGPADGAKPRKVLIKQEELVED